MIERPAWKDDWFHFTLFHFALSGGLHCDLSISNSSAVFRYRGYWIQLMWASKCSGYFLYSHKREHINGEPNIKEFSIWVSRWPIYTHITSYYRGLNTKVIGKPRWDWILQWIRDDIRRKL